MLLILDSSTVFVYIHHSMRSQTDCVPRMRFKKNKKKQILTKVVNSSDNVYLNNHISDHRRHWQSFFDGSYIICMSYIGLLTQKDKSDSILLAQSSVQPVFSREIHLVSETALKWLLKSKPCFPSVARIYTASLFSLISFW